MIIGLPVPLLAAHHILAGHDCTPRYSAIWRGWLCTIWYREDTGRDIGTQSAVEQLRLYAAGQLPVVERLIWTDEDIHAHMRERADG